MNERALQRSIQYFNYPMGTKHIKNVWWKEYETAVKKIFQRTWQYKCSIDIRILFKKGHERIDHVGNNFNFETLLRVRCKSQHSKVRIVVEITCMKQLTRTIRELK